MLAADGAETAQISIWSFEMIDLSTGELKVKKTAKNGRAEDERQAGCDER